MWQPDATESQWQSATFSDFVPTFVNFVNFKASDLSDYKIPANKFKGYLGNKSLECPLATKRQLQSVVHIRSFIIYYTLSSNIILCRWSHNFKHIKARGLMSENQVSSVCEEGSLWLL